MRNFSEYFDFKLSDVHEIKIIHLVWSRHFFPTIFGILSKGSETETFVYHMENRKFTKVGFVALGKKIATRVIYCNFLPTAKNPIFATIYVNSYVTCARFLVLGTCVSALN